MRKKWIILGMLGFLPAASHAYVTNQAAVVVFGQPDLYTNDGNYDGITDHSMRNALQVATYGTKLLITDIYNNRVLVFNTIPDESNASADIVIGQNYMNTGTSGTTASTLNGPYGLFVHTDGKLFVAEMNNNRVLIFNSIPTLSGASANLVLGQENMTSGQANRGGGPAANTLNFPAGMTVIGGRLCIADRSNNRVLIFNSIPTANGTSASNVIGQVDMAGSAANRGGAAAANTLNSPSDVKTDGTRLFIADYSNNRILIYNTLPAVNGASADIVVGQATMAGSTANQGGAPAANTLYYPEGLAVSQNRLYCAEFNNNRVLIYDPIPTANNASAVAVIGQPNLNCNAENQSGSVGPDTLCHCNAVHETGTQLIVGDHTNCRVLIYDNPTNTPSPTSTRTATRTATPTPSRTRTYTATPTATATRTHSPTPTESPVFTRTPTPTRTPTFTRTPTVSPTPTFSPTVTVTPSVSPTSSMTPTATATRRTTATVTPTAMPPIISGITAYPQPAVRGTVRFYYRLDAPAEVSIEIRNVAGEVVTTLKESKGSAGYVSSAWDIAGVAPGIYLYRMNIRDQQGGRVTEWKKLAIVKK